MNLLDKSIHIYSSPATPHIHPSIPHHRHVNCKTNLNNLEIGIRYIWTATILLHVYC